MRERREWRFGLSWAAAAIVALSPVPATAQAPAFECGYAVEPGEDARSFADAYLSAWNERDEVALRTFFARNIVYRDATHGQTLEGIDAVIDYLQQLVKTSPDVRWNVTDVICENPSRLVIRWLSWRRIEGKQVELEGVSILHLVGGRIVTNTDFMQVSR
jgi:ketosteroid isomerase-like protein